MGVALGSATCIHTQFKRAHFTFKASHDEAAYSKRGKVRDQEFAGASGGGCSASGQKDTLLAGGSKRGICLQPVALKGEDGHGFGDCVAKGCIGEFGDAGGCERS